jgi:hypothetical protein
MHTEEEDHLEKYRQWGATSHDSSKGKRNLRMLNARDKGMTYAAIAKRFHLSLNRTRHIIAVQQKMRLRKMQA